MLRILVWLELIASMVLLALAIWPFLDFCSGRFMGLDCESRAIFGVNVFGPLGIVALVCSTWSLKSKSIRPQFLLLVTLFAVMINPGRSMLPNCIKSDGKKPPLHPQDAG
ncbi:MAG: hypothetical protein C4522_04970 [Desulfobacteraceae bacterium]|nr:MAG: hypothetical protein C4522_04970 [Desulfobacteraceae bacterium]